MATLIAFPVLGVATLLQTAIVSRIPLLRGPADLILLVLVSWSLQERVNTAWQWALLAGLIVGWISALPIWAPVVAYLLVTGSALFLRERVWQIPVLAVFVATMLGTLVVHGSSFIILLLAGTPLDLRQSFNLITLPSLLLNLILAIPVNMFISELSTWVYPREIET